jgi:ElaA protein
MELKYECLKFEDIPSHTLYEILKLRQEVFIVEQDCPYLDADGKDYEAFHVIVTKQNEIVAYTRILKKGTSYDEYSSIGRVINKKNVRGKGVGKLLMEYSIQKTFELYPHDSIKISAQTYLHNFYTKLGFQKVGDGYLEDDIPHQAMIYKTNAQ